MPPWPVGQPRPAELRHEFEAAALAYYRQLDDKPFNATDVIFPFMQAHPGAVSRPTLDRWIKRMVDEGLIRRTWRPERNNNRHHPNREAQLNRKARMRSATGIGQPGQQRSRRWQN